MAASLRLMLGLISTLGLTASPAAPPSNAQTSIAQPTIAQPTTPPTLITLHVHNANPADVFLEISRQAGVPLPLASDSLFTTPIDAPPMKISVDLDHVGFWRALSEVCRQCNAKPQPVDGTPTRPLLLDQAFGEHFLTGKIDDRRLFVFEPSRISIERSAYLIPGRITPDTTAASETQKNDEIEFNLYVDPNAPISSLDSIQLLEAADDRGQSLLPRDNHPMPLLNKLIIQPRCALAIPTDGAGFIAKLRGSINVSMTTKVQSIDLPDVFKAIGQNNTFPDFTFQIRSIDAPGRGATMELLVHRTNPQTLTNQVELNLTRIRLIDAAGQQISAHGEVQWDDNDCAYGATFIATNTLQKPIRFLWTIPSKVQPLTVPFEFTNLRLPDH